MSIKRFLRVSAAATLLTALAALPLAAQEKKPAPAPAQKAAPAAAAPAAKAAVAPAPAPVAKTYVDQLKYPKLHPITMPAVVRETLPNGMKLILLEDHSLPLVSMRALVRGGKLAEPVSKPALAAMFGEVQRTGGVKSMTGDQVDDFLERIGASIETNVQDAYGVVDAKTLTDQLDKVLPLYVEFLSSPAFSQDKIDLCKTHLNGMISRRNDDVMGIARREFLQLVYGPKSPYARIFNYDDVDALTREDLLAFHKAFYRPDNTILVVWGDFKADDMKAKLAGAFSGWTAAGPAPAVPAPKIPEAKASVSYVEKKDVEQTTVLMGELGLRLDDPDYPAVNMMSEILGGSMSSRIFIQVRTLKGLAYGAGGFMVPAYDHLGAFYFYTATKPGTTIEALTSVLDEIKKIREAPVTDEELKKAKEGYLNQYAFEFDSIEKIAKRMATYEFYGYPSDFNVKLRDAIEKVTKDDVLKAAQKHLNPDVLTILAVGDASKFDKPLSTVGQVNTIDITIPEPKPKEIIPEATPETLKAGTDLLVNAARAVGEPALRGLKDMTSDGTSNIKTPMGEMELKGTTTWILPDRLHNALTTPMGPMIQVLDGGKAWMSMGPNVRDLPGSMATEMKTGLFTEAGGVLILKMALEGKLQGQLIGKTQFEGKEADDILVKAEDAPIRIYLAPDGTVLGTKKRAQTQEGPADVYRDLRRLPARIGPQDPLRDHAEGQRRDQGFHQADRGQDQRRLQGGPLQQARRPRCQVGEPLIRVEGGPDGPPSDFWHVAVGPSGCPAKPVIVCHLLRYNPYLPAPRDRRRGIFFGAPLWRSASEPS